jgi:peptidoglycan/LPS O-acetylase OafA/YrhL
MSSGHSGPPVVRKHLMTPGQPRPQQRSTNITSVQRWVMSSLTAITIMHMSAGIVVAAYVSDRRSSQIGLLVIAAVFGVLAFVAALLIHRRSPLSWWLLPGLLPAVVGAYLILA